MSDKTQKWVTKIVGNFFKNVPGGDRTHDRLLIRQSL